MPNILPGAVWHPIDVGGRARRRKGRGLVGHVAVSASKNLVPGPLSSRNADWHFYLPKSGPAIQYIDLDLQCWATGAGNGSLAAFESEGGLGTTAQVNAEPWTENQLDWAARILRYMHDTEDVPLRVMASSATGERGFGTHRLGVPGYMAAGGEQWSSSAGKLCPGDAKHAQRFEIVRRAGGITSTGDDMPITNEDADLLWRKPALEYGVPPIIWLKDARNDTAVIRSTLVALDKDLRLDLAAKQKQLDASALREAALLAAVEKLAGGTGVTKQDIVDAMADAVVKVDVSVRGDTGVQQP